MVGIVLTTNRGEAAMWALVVLAIYLTPFFLLGWAIDAAMKRYAVDLRDVQSQAGANRAPRKLFLLGAWRTEK
jgi:hypothetical protein